MTYFFLCDDILRKVGHEVKNIRHEDTRKYHIQRYSRKNRFQLSWPSDNSNGISAAQCLGGLYWTRELKSIRYFRRAEAWLESWRWGVGDGFNIATEDRIHFYMWPGGAMGLSRGICGLDLTQSHSYGDDY